MSTIEIKTSIKTEIEKINDEQLLSELLEIVYSFSNPQESNLSVEQKAELDNRWEEYLRGEGESFSAREVVKELKAAYSK